jgi:porphobilinogen synthase
MATITTDIGPGVRPRRLRGSDALRALVRETGVTRDDLVMPVFVVPGSGVRREIASMPGIYHHSVDELDREAEALLEAGVRRVILFGIPPEKDAAGSDSFSDDGIIQRALRHLRARYPGLYLITDVCLCEYTDHGHCGLVADGDVDNDETLVLLQRQAVSHARAGAHMVAPSGMMDGVVKALRTALDAGGFAGLPIMSYSVKYASAFYGPFREAAGSAPQYGDRRTYQMDPANAREGLREAALDLAEGADILMVKPALAYLDVLRRLRERFDVPLAAFNVSGEYSMVKAAAARGWVDEEAVMMEVLTSIKRAGADIILTYFARDAGRMLG